MRVIPLTEPGPLWSQREYAACRKIGLGFAAHNATQTKQHFHYKFPDCCTTVIVGFGPLQYVDHDFEPDFDWIERCRTSPKLR